MEAKSPKTIKEFTLTSLDDQNKEIETTYILKQPTARVVRDSRWRYSVVYNQALKEGLLTERQMSELLNPEEDTLSAKNQTSDKDISRLTSMYIRAGILQQELDEEEDFDAKRNIAQRLSELRQEIFQEETSLKAPYNNTAEQRAEEARLDFLLFNMVFNKSGERVWDTEEDFEEDTNVLLCETAKVHLIYWMNDLPEDWQENLPETKILREGLEKDIKQATEFKKQIINKEPEHQVKKEKKTTQKKKTRKRKSKKNTSEESQMTA